MGELLAKVLRTRAPNNTKHDQIRSADEIERLSEALGKIALRLELNGDEMQRIALKALNKKEKP